MKKEDLETFKDKNILIVLNNSYTYSGIIISLSDDCLKLDDRYSGEVLITFDNIKFIKEVKDGGERKRRNY